jgi:hypothetical protein
MKPLKIVVPLVLLIGISAGVYVGVSKNVDQKAEEEVISYGAGEFMSFDSDDITNFSITVDGETYETYTEDGGSNWSFVDTNVKVNYGNVVYAIDAMSSLSTTKRVEENAEDLSKYGLDHAVTVSCSDGTDTYALEIGNTSPTGESYYIKSVDNNDVYTISAEDGVLLHLSKDDLKFRYITDSYTSAVNKIIYKKGDEVIYDCEKLDGKTWSLVEPTTSLTVNLASISNIADLLIRADVVDFITENPTAEELKQYGLDTPQYTIELADDDEDRIVYFGNRQEDEDNVIYAQFADTKEIVTFYVGELGIIDSSIDAVLDSTIYTDEKQKITNVTINYDGTTTSIGVNYDSDSRAYTYTKNGVVDEDKASFIVDATLSISLYNVDFTAVPTGEPTFTISFTRNEDPTAVTLKFIPTDENSTYYYVLVNDEYQGAIVRDRYLQSEGNLLYLLKNS